MTEATIKDRITDKELITHFYELEKKGKLPFLHLRSDEKEDFYIRKDETTKKVSIKELLELLCLQSKELDEMQTQDNKNFATLKSDEREKQRLREEILFLLWPRIYCTRRT